MSNEILVLNKFWTPIRIVSFRNGIRLLFKYNTDQTPKAYIISTKTYQAFSWEEWMKIKPENHDETLITSKCSLIRPKIITISTYTGTSKHKVLFNKRGVFQRDNSTCLYCGNQFKEQELSIDHVIPVSHGGKTNWLNCATACRPCNRKKGNKSLEKCKMNLKIQPYEPTWNQIFAEYLQKFQINFLKLT